MSDNASTGKNKIIPSLDEIKRFEFAVIIRWKLFFFLFEGW
jgi:hypothetical protein